MPLPDLPRGPETRRIADDAAAFNERLVKLAAAPEFADDHVAREETSMVLDQLNDDVDANRQAVFSEVHKFLPELADTVRVHDGDMVAGLEYNNGRLSFHGPRFGVLDGKHVDVPLDAFERRSGTVVTTDGRVLPFVAEGNHDAEQEQDFPLYPFERKSPLPPLFATGSLPPHGGA